MPLQKQLASINFTQGVDTKTDPKFVIPGKLTRLENGVFKQGGSIHKRNGYELLGQQTLDESDLGASQALATFNDELLVNSNQMIYAYSESTGRWVDKGDAASIIISTRSIVRNTANQLNCDSAVLNGIALYAWEDSRGGIRASVYDELTGTPLLSDASVHATATVPRCLAFDNYLFVFYYVSGSLYARRINPISPTAFDSAVEIAADINTTDPNYDVAVVTPTRVVYAYNVQGASEINVALMTNVPAVVSGSSVTISEAATDSIAVVIGDNSTVHLAWANTSDGLRCTILNNGLSELYAPFDIEAYTSTAITQLTGYKRRDSAGIRWYYEIYAASSYNRYIKTNTTTNAGVAGTASVLIRSLGLASKAFAYADSDDEDDKGYVLAVHESTLQPTYFLLRQDGLVVGKMQAGLAGGLRTIPTLANISATSTGVYSVPIIVKGELKTQSGTVFSLTGVSRTKIDFTSDAIFNTAQLGENLLIVGGVLSMYDGQSVVEHGFHLYPENPTCTAQTTGGSLADGVYQLCFVYEWTDNKGQVHRSAPSVPVSKTVSGGSGNGSIDVAVPSLRVTSKKDTRAHVSIVGYVTEASGEIFYRYTSVTAPTLNDPSADSVTLPDVTTVSTSNEILYTTGGVLENIAPPAASCIEVYKGRIVLTGTEDGNTFYFSKTHVEGYPVEFTDSFFQTVEKNGGPIAGSKVLDDKLILFKDDRPYITFGEGPIDTGEVGEFALPEVINVDVGCPNTNSAVVSPNGLMFKSKKGIYAVTGSEQVQYVGADVEEWNDENVIASTLNSDSNQSRFLTEAGPALVYDYFFNQWSTFTNHSARDAVIWKNQFVYVDTSGRVLLETPDAFKDVDSSINLRMETGWINLAGMQGLQRVYRFAILGEYKSPHSLRVRVAYDYSDAYSYTYVFTPDTSLDVNLYGDDAVYGESVYGGTTEGAYRFRARLDRQKCSAIRFLIEDLVTTATDGSQEAYSITNLTLEVGLKGGISRLRSAQTLSSS